MKQVYLLPALFSVALVVHVGWGEAPLPVRSGVTNLQAARQHNAWQDTIKSPQDTIKTAYVREDDPKTKKKAPPVKKSRVSFQRDVQRASISRQSTEGNMVDVVVMQAGRVIRNLEDMQLIGSSGNHLATQNFIGFENLVYPFEGTVRFKASNQMGTATYDREVRFVVIEPGRWVLRIDL